MPQCWSSAAGMQCWQCMCQMRLQARVTNTSRHLATAVEVFAHDTSTFPAATAHSVNLTTLPESLRMPDDAVFNVKDSCAMNCAECRSVSIGLTAAAGMRAFLIRSGDKDWGLLYGAAPAFTIA